MRTRPLRTIPLAVSLGAGAWASDPAAAQQQQHACDANDALIDFGESGACPEREFGELVAGEDVLTQERLGGAGQGEQGRTFSEVDENADGAISREEWARWHEQRFTAATQTGGESGIPAADYESMEWAKEGYARPTPEDAAQQQQQQQ